MPEGGIRAFERDLGEDDFLSHQYEETLLITGSIRDVAADRKLIEIFRMTSGEETKAFMEEKRSGRRFLNQASRVAVTILLVAVVTRILLLPPSKNMESLYLMYYEPAGHEALVSRGSVSDEPDKLLREAFVEHKKRNYVAALYGFESAPTLTEEISFLSVICYLKLDDPENAIARLLPLVEMGDKCLYFQPAKWCLSMAYLKSHQKENTLSSLERIVETGNFYAEKAEAVLDKLEEWEKPLNKCTFYG